MRRTAATEDRPTIPTARIAGLSGGQVAVTRADDGDSFPPSGGRHRRSAGSATVTLRADRAAATTALDATVLDPTAADPTAADADPDSVVTARLDLREFVERAPTGPSTIRRLAPAGAGAAVMLVAALAVSLIPQEAPAAGGPELSSQLAQGAASSPSSSPSPSADPLPVAAAGPTGVATGSRSRPPAGPAAASGRAAAGTARAAAASPTRPLPVGTGDGTQAATRLGWQLAASDEFDGSGLSDNWGPYDGRGNDGKGRRTPAAISVSGGILTITGDGDGNTGGMAWNNDQTYGRWEVRARFPKGDDQYHPVLLLWPADGWPPEVDFSETTSASRGTSFYLHYSSSNEQVSASKNLDLTQWHDYAVEWESGRVTGFVDGAQWFQSTDGHTIPDVPMHLAIQLDYFPDGGSPRPTEMDVDYVRIYR